MPPDRTYFVMLDRYTHPLFVDRIAYTGTRSAFRVSLGRRYGMELRDIQGSNVLLILECHMVLTTGC